MTDNDAIKGLDAREDGVYITYVPAGGADPVSKKLGAELTVKTFSASAGQTLTFASANEITMASLVCVDNRAFQSSYNKKTGSTAGYGDNNINVSRNTITIKIDRASGNYRLSYC